jgi:tripartite-type tricarboxylate transporter receptor subunit TctC
MTALIGGHVDAAITALSHGIRHRDRVRILAHAGRQRIPGIPDVPTFRELGHNVTAELTWGVGVPAGTPAEAINRLSSTLLQVMRQPEILNALPDEGLVPMFLGPAESQAFVNRQVSVYRELIGLLR